MKRKIVETDVLPVGVTLVIEGVVYEGTGDQNKGVRTA